MTSKNNEGSRPNNLKNNRSLRVAFVYSFLVISSFNLIIIAVSHIIFWFEGGYNDKSILAPDERNLFLILVVSYFLKYLIYF